MFQKLLIANRGEIAVRVIRTCRAMGIRTVAVYSEVDAHALHVLEADEAVCIGPPAPHASYLNIDAILDAVRQTDADAIHPGYGFLSENAAFARACAEAGVTFVGPPAEVIEQLGDKLVARKLMQEHNVPVTPGGVLEGDGVEDWKAQAEALGYPVLLKAAAGGGGKGMRVVHAPDQFAASLKTAASEAKSAFGDDRVYIEKYIEKPRHIEFQVFADQQGNTIHLFERECSIQRRHQKIIEETPSPALDDALREKMGAAAVAAAKAAGYVNAGTVEFLLDDNTKEFYFLEVNTRLQVEHPITEMVTGLDLVQWQLRVATGQPLPMTQEEVTSRGHAIECRIYAEDPAQNFVPSPGTIQYFHAPNAPSIRHDGGVYSGAEIPVYYDPILSKLISYGPDRETARTAMIDALRRYVVLGIQTPIPFLIDALSQEAFVQGDLTTHFIQQHMQDWKPDQSAQDLACIAYILDELIPSRQMASTGPSTEQMPTPWQTIGAWRIGDS